MSTPEKGEKTGGMSFPVHFLVIGIRVFGRVAQVKSPVPGFHITISFCGLAPQLVSSRLPYGR
jgi:hypothetical protein